MAKRLSAVAHNAEDLLRGRAALCARRGPAEQATSKPARLAHRTRALPPPSRKAAKRRNGRAADGAPSLTERAYANLEEMIVTLRLAPGSVISEVELSRRLGIGRTPIREALQRLAHERLVRVLPRRGIIVSEVNVQSQLRLLEARREIERLIAKCAARRATADERTRFLDLARRFEESSSRDDEVEFTHVDREFNELSAAAARNEFAARAIAMMHSLSRRFWFIYHRQAGDMPVIARLHAAVARAIAKGDEGKACETADALLASITQFTRNTVIGDR